MVRRGSRVVLTWRAVRGTRYVVSAGPTRATAGRRVLARVRSGRAVVRLRRGERWLQLRARGGVGVVLRAPAR